MEYSIITLLFIHTYKKFYKLKILDMINLPLPCDALLQWNICAECYMF